MISMQPNNRFEVGDVYEHEGTRWNVFGKRPDLLEWFMENGIGGFAIYKIEAVLSNCKCRFSFSTYEPE